MGRLIAFSAIVTLLCTMLAGCGTATTTPTGTPCTSYNSLCYYYYNHAGTPIACTVDGVSGNDCSTTSGPYYEYDTLNGKTIECSADPNWICPTSKLVTPVAQCPPPNFVYDTLVNKGQAWKVVEQDQDQNGTSGLVQATFTSTKSDTITASASVSVPGHADAVIGVILASVEAHINTSVRASVTTVVDNNYNLTVPAGKTAYGIYGVRVQVTSGHLYDTKSCGGSKADYGTVISYIPIAIGWCVWLSGQQPCPTVSS